MQSDGIEGLLVETHNWGKTVAFWQGLGYELEFETDHHSGQLRHPRGGPYIFVAERPPHQALKVVLAIGVADAPDEIVAAARAAGLRDAIHVSADELAARYFADRADGLRPATSEQLLVATA